MTASGFFTIWYRHVLPLALVFRLVTLTAAPSLAIAADYVVPATDSNVVAASTLQGGDFLAATNQARTAAGLAPLRINSQLEKAAYAKAVDMATQGYWDHFRPADHKAPWDFIRENGYSYKVAGENLARGFATVQGITQAWMDSPTHRANVLSEKYTDVGFASVYATDAETGNRVLLTVQMFGAR